MLDPRLWDILTDGTPNAVFTRSLSTASMGESGVLPIEYAETPDALENGSYRKIHLFLNRRLAEHFQTHIDATITK